MGKYDYLFKKESEDITEERVSTKKGKGEKYGGAVGSKARERQFIKLENLKEIVKLPTKNQIFFLKTKGYFNAITFLDLIVDLEGKLIKVRLATWGTNKDTVSTLRYYLENKTIKDVKYLTSTFLKRDRYKYEYETLKAMNLELILKNSHAKIYLFETKKGSYYCVIGSGNLVNNTKLEVYTIINSKEVFDFYDAEFNQENGTNGTK